MEEDGINNAYVAQNDHNLWVSGGNEQEVDMYVQDDGSPYYQVVQFGAAQMSQSVGQRTTKDTLSSHREAIHTQSIISYNC